MPQTCSLDLLCSESSYRDRAGSFEEHSSQKHYCASPLQLIQMLHYLLRRRDRWYWTCHWLVRSQMPVCRRVIATGVHTNSRPIRLPDLENVLSAGREGKINHGLKRRDAIFQRSDTCCSEHRASSRRRDAHLVGSLSAPEREVHFEMFHPAIDLQRWLDRI